jgi:hypothetical protein
MTQIHTIGRSPCRRHALRYLLARPSPGRSDDPELVLDASGTIAADAFTGAMLLANVEHHLGRSRAFRAQVAAPHSGETLGRFTTLLTLKPDRCELELPDGHTAPVRDPRVLVPAVRIRSIDEADNFALFLRFRSQAGHLGDARLSPAEAGFLAVALPTLAENSLVHAPNSSCGTVVCSALEADTKEVQLVVTDLGTTVSRSPDSLARLREAWSRSREHRGGLFYAVELARQRNLDISLQILTGDAAGRWRHGRWNSDESDAVRGWTAAITIHR